MANHTSGLPRLPSNLRLNEVDPNNPYKEYDEEKLQKYLIGELKLNNEPGKKFEYSNLGAGLLGYLLSTIEKKSYEDLLQSILLSKYKMNNTTTIRSTIEDNLVKGINAYGKETSNWDLNALVGAGGILSSVKDLARFAQAHFDASDPVLNLTRKSTYTTGNESGVGLGWMINSKPGEESVWHNGGTGGYRSSMTISTKNNTAVIILSNLSAFNRESANIDNLGKQLMKTLDNE